MHRAALAAGLLGVVAIAAMWSRKAGAKESEAGESQGDLWDGVDASQAVAADVQYGPLWESAPLIESMPEFENMQVNSEKNIAAFCRAIRVGEGTSDAEGYRRLVGGGNFQSLAVHPSENLDEFPAGGPRSFTKGGFYVKQFDSTAAGAYQITWSTWKDLRRRYPGRFLDFSPATQDDFAVMLIRQAGALDDVSAGRVERAVQKVKGRWESLPGSGTRPKNEVSIAAFNRNFVSYGGGLA